MTHPRSLLSTFKRAGTLPAALLVGSVAVLALATSASADPDAPPADLESTNATNASDESDSSEALRGPPDLHAPTLRGPPRLHARRASESDTTSESGDGADSEESADTDDSANTDEAPLETLGLPTGADKSGVTSKTLSIPKGSGSIQGMGESFSAQLSTGIATFSVPFALPAARGKAQPALGLSYSSSSGHGVAGVGWDVGVPFIARQTDRGVPGYDDRADWHPNQDRFVFNGGQELVPICVVGAGLECAGALTAPSLTDSGTSLSEAAVTELMPAWSSGWQYFRPRVEGSFLRFFWSSDHKSWRVQDKSGVTLELGVPFDGSGYTGGLELNADKPAEIYRWHLTRQYDSHGSTDSAEPLPLNVVVYRYEQDGGMAYVSDLYDTPPRDNSLSAPVSEYAHHTRLVYEQRTDPTFSYRSGWKIEQRLRLARVDVASKTFNEDESSARRLVRRYHLDYQADRHVSLLASVQVEGRCNGSELSAPSESSNGELAASTGCGRLPPMEFRYSRVAPFTTSGSPGVEDLPGWEGFDERLRTMAGSPPHSVDEELSDLFDINSDSLPDVLVTAPGLYSDGHGLFLNGEGGFDSFGAARNVQVDGVLEANANTIKLSNLNLAPLDLDGDGTIELLHMPKVKTYSVYRPEQRSGAWWWAGREVKSATNQNPKIDFGNDTPEIQVLDVNFDGLVDVVVTTGTELQTFLSLGRLPAGDGQFGHGQWATASTSTLSTDPITTCVPWSGNPARFSDSDIKLADMNGDGITDIVRVRRGAIQYWPGRGNGLWGTGDPDDCEAGTFGEDRHIPMDESPDYSDIEGDTLRLDDVNGDGLADLVQVRMTDVDVWINEDGLRWTDRHVIADTPASPSYANRVRLVDVNGSGTRDILWGDGDEYKYLDLEGGQRSWLLVGVENGLGKTTTIDYSTSAYEMLEAESGSECTSPDSATPWAQKWCTKMPTVAHVVKRVTESDNLSVAGQGPRDVVTEYSYRDPVFEGRQREFRGFRRARAHRLGDSNSPGDITESVFLLGECKDEAPDDGIEACAISERWRDNPREALKGLPIVTEKYSEGGAYLSTEVTQYRLKHLYTGLDGRAVRHAVQVAQSSYLYDTGPFSATGAGTVPYDVVDRSWFESGDENVVADTSFTVSIRSGSAVRIESEARTDGFGNREMAIAHGCKDNCGGSDGTVTEADQPISTVTLAEPIENENSRWLWRTVKSWVVGGVEGPGAAAGARRNEQTTTYNAAGEPTAVHARLAGSLGLYRFQPGGPQPTAAAVDGPSVLLGETQYDPYGNPTSQTGPNNRCTALNYDSAYAALPTSETVYPEGCPNGDPIGTGLTVQAQAYDRGFGLVTVVINMQQQPTAAAYDEFGRIISVTRPDPAVQGALSPEPSVLIEYFLPPAISPYYSAIHTQTQDGATPSDAAYLESWSFVDGFGRTLLTLNEADPNAGDSADEGDWIVSGQVDFDSKSAVRRKYLEYFWDGSPEAFPVTQAPSAQYGSQRYDAFGRQLQTMDLDGTVTLQSRYHALSTDLSDAADLEPGPHQGTYASVRKDGHGRTTVTTERAHSGGAIEARHVITQYHPTGEPRFITRRKGSSSSNDVTRWIRYDSLGRMVLNVERNTADNDPGPLDDSAALPGNLRAWRYAYNLAGDLVGTSDARGCGINFTYDGTGRLLSEDYCRCATHHAPYSDTKEVTYHYDVAPSGAPSDFGAFVPPFNYGRLVAVRDLASETWSKYDGLGRVIKVETRVARPVALDATTGAPPPTPAIATRYAAEWYFRDFAFDAADRETAASTGSRHNDLRGAVSSAITGTNTSVVTTAYTRRGTIASVSGSYGPLVASIARTADGLVKNIVYGDAGVTTTASQFDNRRRLRSIQTYRTPPALWSWTSNYSPVPGYSSGVSDARSFQLLLQDEDYSYDSVGNPTETRDWRLPEEWPTGAKPATRKIQYDDLYRVSRVDYEYSSDNGTDPWTSPNAADQSGTNDPRRATPSPQSSFGNRTLWQTFQYDWLGNNEKTDDDAHGFYDRSLGGVTEKSGKPYQLGAANNTSSGGSRTGSLTTEYDAAGNLTQLIVDRTNQSGTCLPTGASCDQRFEYAWDEVGRLVRARRFDASTAPGTGTLAADLRYRYDAGDQRVVKTAVAGTSEIHTVYVFDTLELRRTTWLSASNNYDRSNNLHEVPYLFANGVRLGRVVYETSAKDVPEVTGGPAAIPGGNSPLLHVLFELGDHLGSTSIVLDKASGELVEKSSFLAFGATESDYRTERWKGFREDYRFTGKEEDVEVGLVYFGKRFLSPALGRWVSADPLGVHGPGEADWNLYAYVLGQVLKAIDPLGLLKEESGAGGASAGTGAGGSQGAGPVEPRTAEYERGHEAGERNWNVDDTARQWREQANFESLTEAERTEKNQAIDRWVAEHREPVPRAGTAKASQDKAEGYHDAYEAKARLAKFSERAQVAISLLGMLEGGGKGGGKPGVKAPKGGVKPPRTTPRSAPKPGVEGGPPPNMSPAGAARRGAFREAKRNSGVPVSQKPSGVAPNVNKQGQLVPGRVYEFTVPAKGGGTRTVRIRDDAAGHDYGPGNAQNRVRHFNDEAGNHYDY